MNIAEYDIWSGSDDLDGEVRITEKSDNSIGQHINGLVVTEKGFKLVSDGEVVIEYYVSNYYNGTLKRR